MSASLVGSEMCIRDSFCGGLRLLGPLEKHLGRARRPISSPPADSSWFSACLLYTSDAADDM
eukprot:9683431-Alexandrium_andersonii.AAC.1